MVCFPGLNLLLIFSKLIESNRGNPNRLTSLRNQNLRVYTAEQAYLATNDSDDYIIIHRSRLANQALEKVNPQLLF